MGVFPNKRQRGKRQVYDERHGWEILHARVIVSITDSPFNTLMVLNLRDDLDVLSFVSENIAQSSHTVSAPDERGKDYIYLQSRISCELADVQWYVSMIGGFNGNSYVQF